MENTNSTDLIKARPIDILKSDEDKYGTDISKMSDFFQIAVDQSLTLIRNDKKQFLDNPLQPVDMALISESFLKH